MSAINKGLFSSERDDWSTPPEIFERYGEPFSLTLDVCASHDNAKCTSYFTRERCGLTHPWWGRCWMNPPYGRGMMPWIKKAIQEVRSGRVHLVVMLLPARTDTAWWYELQKSGLVLRTEFLKGRVKFLQNGKAVGTAPFPSVIVILWSAPVWGGNE